MYYLTRSFDAQDGVLRVVPANNAIGSNLTLPGNRGFWVISKECLYGKRLSTTKSIAMFGTILLLASKDCVLDLLCDSLVGRFVGLWEYEEWLVPLQGGRKVDYHRSVSLDCECRHDCWLSSRLDIPCGKVRNHLLVCLLC